MTLFVTSCERFGDVYAFPDLHSERERLTTMRAWTGVALGVLLLACTSEDEPKPLGSGNGQCARRDTGSYIAKYTQRTGDCGEGAEVVINPGPQPTEVSAPCTGNIAYSADNCEVTYDSTCPNDGAVKGGELSITGKSKWSTDGAMGSAVEQWVMRDPEKKTMCLSTYDVTITRQ